MEEAGGETLADEETMTAIRGDNDGNQRQSAPFAPIPQVFTHCTGSRSLLFGPFSAPTNPPVFDPFANIH